MAEVVVLDPDEVAVARGELDISNYISFDGIDWGTAEITAYMAEQARGQSPVDYRVPNRTVTIPLILRDVDDDLTFYEVRSALQAKVARFQAEGGWLKRVQSDSDTNLYLDVVNASLIIGGDWYQAHRDVDMKGQLVLECLPEFYGDEITLDDHTETTAAELIFTETDIAGDYPARVRIVVDDDSAADQRGLIWSIRSRHYSSASTAMLAYEAESLLPLDTAGRIAKVGASGGTVVTHGTLSTNWTPVLSTNIPILSNAWMTHQGTHRVFARVFGTAGSAIQARFLWDVGDFVFPVANDAQTLYDAGTFQILDMGEVRLDPVPTGDHRWQGQIQAKGAVGGESFSIDRVWIANTDDGFGILRSPLVPVDNLGTYSARSEFNTEAGTITGDSLAVGGTWTGAGDVDDFVVANTIAGKSASRTAVSDADLNTGRYITASSPTLSDAVVQAYFLTSNGVITGDARYGVLARYVDTSNWLWFGIAITSGQTAMAVIKRVAGTATTLVSTIPAVTATGAALRSNMFFGLRLMASSGGFYTGSIAIGGSGFIEILSGSDTDLATGGTLDDGKTGLYDAQTSATAATRYYLQFGAWVPVRDAVILASRTTELSTTALTRQDTSGAAYGPVTYPLGDLPRLPPATLDNRTAQIFLKGSRGDIETLPDSNIDDISARVSYRPCWLFVGES